VLGYAFRYSNVAFYLRTEIVLTDRRLYAARPNTLLGLLPVGTRRQVFPIDNVASIGAVTRLSILSLVLAVLAILIGISALSSPDLLAGAVAWIVIGLLLLLAVPRQAIEIMNTGGGTIRFPVSVFQRSLTLEFANRVSEAVAQLSRRPEPSAYSTVPDTDPRDPKDRLVQLSQLRDQGLISADEYAAKRSEILSRL
jgi:hypothetical protein